MQIDAATATLIGAAIGSLSSGATAIIILLINKRSEERRQSRELALNAAANNWQISQKVATQQGWSVLPFEVFIVHMAKLFEVLGSKNLTADTLAVKLREVQRFSDIATAEANRYTKELMAAREKEQSETSSQFAPRGDRAPHS